ncbi:hypothetical protein Q3G72_032389 [Acer saccharum]|nr:hypothetical protein Q3G72_032389 [Acer saccharum]
MSEDFDVERTLESTPTWAVAVVCFVMLAISIAIEHLIHMIGKWLHNRHKLALVEALEKVKAELMLMGFISLLLTMGQTTISDICVSRNIANSWHPCNKQQEEAKNEDAEKATKKLNIRYDKCSARNQVAFVSAYGVHQLHIFIFILAVFHIIYCLTTLAMGRTKMKKWKVWEDETKTLEYQYYNDPERFRFARDTSFGRRHLNIWTSSSVSLSIVCFFRQFFGSVTKVDYLTLRHGFIMAHLAPGSETKFDFNKYISKSLEQDFVVVVGITPVLWFVALLFLLTNTHGWMSYLWLPFIPLIIILLVGAKLQMVITKLGLRIQERGDVVKGAPVVQPGDELFWFGKPRFILFLIHLVLFQNAFQLAFFIWSMYAFKGIRSCYHQKTEDIVIRISMGILIQILCSYVTMPLYALVTQMGTTMKPTIFNERVAAALKNWHHSAKKNTKHSHGRHSEPNTPFSSRPQTPTRGMSPVHLLHGFPKDSLDTTSPRRSTFDHDRWDPESLGSPRHYHANDSHHGEGSGSAMGEQEMVIRESTTINTQLPPGPGPIRTEHHEIHNTSSGFSFAKRGQ